MMGRRWLSWLWRATLALTPCCLPPGALPADAPPGLATLARTPARPPRTLVVFNASRFVFGLGNELEFLQLQLRRLTTDLEVVPFAEVTPAQIAAADYLVVFCPQADPPPASGQVKSLLAAAKPILWIGWGTSAVGGIAMNRVEPTLQRVRYQGTDWDLDRPAGWIPSAVEPGFTGRILLSPSTGTLSGSASKDLALAWQRDQVSAFSAIPAPGRLGFLFSDLLLDFYGTGQLALKPSCVVLRLEDYQAGSDHPEFRRMVDFLASRGHPFAVSVTPAWRDAAGHTGATTTARAVATLASAPEFVEGLRYAQARGGRIVLRGCVRAAPDAAGGAEFWDSELDRPVVTEPAAMARAVREAATLLLQQGLLPIAWQTPGDAASRAAYHEVARVFSTAMERPQLSDLTMRETAWLSAMTVDREGRRVVPENLGFVPGEGTNGLSTMGEQAAFIARLRGTVGAAYFHAYLTQEKLARLVDALESVEKPFLDLVELDNWVHVPGKVLVTGNALCKVKMGEGVLTWRAMDQSGRQLVAEQESALPGEHILRRKGKGAYELYEFTEAKP